MTHYHVEITQSIQDLPYITHFKKQQCTKKATSPISSDEDEEKEEEEEDVYLARITLTFFNRN